MSSPTDKANSGTDSNNPIIPDSLTSHILEQTQKEEPAKDPFFVYQRELAAGTKLQHYEIESVLGGGGFGITYLAKDILLNRHVVIKENFPSAYSHRDPLNGRIIPNNSHDLESYNWALRSFINEARTIAELDHPGIAKILSIFESNGTAYFAMEFIDGFSLEYLGEQLAVSKKRYTEDELKGLLFRLLDILSYLHQQGIYHRDIKPGNILLNREGIPVLIDFGAARHADAARSLTIITTQGYSSPEQALGLDTLGPWSDLYSLGATFYALLTGAPPERSEVRMNEDNTRRLHSIKELSLIYSSRFLKTIDKSLEPYTENRYKSAKQWMEDLDILPGSSQSTIRLSSHQSRHARPPLPGGTPSTAAAAAAPSSERQTRKSSAVRLSLGMLLFMVFAGVLLSLVEFDKHSFFPHSLQESITPGGTKPDLPIPPTSPTLDSIPIPEIGIPLDSPSKVEQISNFELRLTDSSMTTTSLPSPLPATIRISAIYIMETAPGSPSSNEQSKESPASISLVIRDLDNNIVARSSNKVPIAPIGGQLPICFTFPSLPKLDAHKTYTCTFLNSENKPEKINISCLLFSPSENNPRNYPLCRIICSPDAKKTLEAKTEEERGIFNTLSRSDHNSKSIQDILSIPDSITNTAFIRKMAEDGYPIAQFKMSKIEAIPPTPDNLTKSIIWLYKSAIGGFGPAQKELGALLMDSHSKFPDIPTMPPIAERNYAQAARFLRMTFQQRDPYSLYLLGMIYGQGWGVPKSPTTAGEFYEKASELNPDLHTKYISSDNTILAFWSPRELKPHSPLRVKCEIPLELINRMKGIKLIGTSGLSSASVSHIRLIWNNKLIRSVPEAFNIIPGEKPSLIPLKTTPLPPTVIPSMDNPVYLEMEISTEGTNTGIIELETQKMVDSPR